jgi:hypothetical protein
VGLSLLFTDFFAVLGMNGFSKNKCQHFWIIYTGYGTGVIFATVVQYSCFTLFVQQTIREAY